MSLLLKLMLRLPDFLLKALISEESKISGEKVMALSTHLILSIIEKNRITRDISSLDPQKMRDFYDVHAGRLEKKPPAMATKDHNINVDQGTITIREYVPGNLEDVGPALVYLHGGGWVIGSIRSHDILCRHLAHLSNWKVFSVGYRLAPDYKYPIPLEDCDRAFEWVLNNAASLNINPNKLSIGGDSAGGNLSTCICIKRKEENRKLPEKQLLLYPGVDGKADYPSCEEFADGFFLTKDVMDWFANHYIRKTEDLQDFYMSPIHYQNPSGLPPAIVITAGFDPLRDMGIAYAKHLRDAGVKVTEREYQGMIHGFANFTIDPLAYNAVVEIVEDLKN